MDDRTQHLIEVTIDLLATDGLGVPTARIARQAGVANGTLFNIFPTKQALLDQVYLTLKGEMVTTFGSLIEAGDACHPAFAAAWRAYVVWAMARPARHKVLRLLKGGGAVSPATVAAGEQRFIGLAGMVEAAMARGDIAPIGFQHFIRLAEAEADVVIALASEGHCADAALDGLIDNGFKVFWKGVAS